MRHGVALEAGQRDQEGEDRGIEGGTLGVTKTWQKEAEERQEDGSGLARTWVESKEEAEKRAGELSGEKGRRLAGMGVYRVMQGQCRGDAQAPHKRCTEGPVCLILAASRPGRCPEVEREEGGGEQCARDSAG